jgi:hypothetical protein
VPPGAASRLRCAAFRRTTGLKSDQFIREVDEELQRDRLAALWRRYGRLVIAAAVLLVLGVAGYEGWKAWRHAREQAEAARLAAAEALLVAGRAAEAAGAFADAAAEGGPGVAALARLREAAALGEAGRPGEAMAALDRVAAAPDADPLLRELAVILAVTRELDRGDPAALEARLLPLAEAGRPWRSSARELLAMLALRRGDQATARRLLDELVADAAVPPGVQQRAQALRQSLGPAGS